MEHNGQHYFGMTNTGIENACSVTFDFSNGLPKGETYEDQYGRWLKIFEEIAQIPRTTKVVIVRPPWCWVPLLLYLGCYVKDPLPVWDNCNFVMRCADLTMTRTALEVLCAFRPETVDALYKVDMEWKVHRLREFSPEKDFLITNNNSFWRPEIREYMHHFMHYEPTKQKALIVPCAADKPYPAPMHKKVLEIMPSDFYLITATGALGLVPQDLWPKMPNYDAGLPYEWRMMQMVGQYFTENPHTHLIVYCDYQNLAIQKAMQVGGFVGAIFVNEENDQYLDLMHPKRLAKLEAAFKLCEDVDDET